MYSYIVLTWDARDGNSERAGVAAELQRQVSSLRDFRTVCSAPGFYVAQKDGLSSACDACVLPDDGGVILGTLFSWPTVYGGAKRQLQLAPDEASRVIESRGRYLVTRFWGRYVAFVRTPMTNRCVVMRDPSGMLPCFRTSHRGVQIWFSQLEDLSPLGIPQATINWAYVERHVAAGLLKTHETGLSGVHEVLPGESCEVADTEVRRKVTWDPGVISNTEPIEDSNEAAQRLRSVTQACVDAWASAYSGVLHALSGGLDSSIVATLLGKTPSRIPVTCLNYFTTDTEGDERRYARVVAEKAGFPLIEKQRTPRSIDLRSVLNIAATPSPWIYQYAVEHAAYELEQAQQCGATAVFTGGGGDGIFYRAEAGYSVADYVHRHGITSRLPAIALNAARLEGRSLFSVLWHAYADRRPGARRNSAAEYANQQTLVSAATMASHSQFLHARFEVANGVDVPPGKQMQITTTSTPPSFYDQFNQPQALERVPPLVSQPVVELCLKIPTYVLVENGWDRSLARKAFATDLPAAIVNRRGKGAIQHHVRTIFNTNLKFMREFMLDGELSRRGILDRKQMENCLSGRQSLGGTDFTEILDHVSTEAWINRQVRAGAKSPAG